MEELTPIHSACKSGDLEGVKNFSAEKDLCQPYYNIKGQTPLHEACIKGHLDIVKYLTRITHSMHKDIYSHDCDGFTPLHLACKHGHLDIVHYFINECRWDESHRPHYKQNLLHLACTSGQTEIVRFLVDNTCDEANNSNKQKANCDVHGVDDIGNTPLHYASKYGHLNIVQYLMSLSKSEIVLKNFLGNTPFHLAVQQMQEHVVEYFLLNYYDYLYVNEQEKKSLNTIVRKYEIISFLRAAIEGHVDLFKHFLELVAGKLNVSYEQVITKITDSDGNTALHLAITSQQLKVIQYITDEVNISLRISNNYGDTCLDLLAKRVQLGLSISNDCGNTCLDLLYEHNHPSVVNLNENWQKFNSKEDNYIEFGSNCYIEFQLLKYLKAYKHLDSVNQKGYTSLHIACKHGHLNIVKFLASVSNNVYLADYQGLTPLHTACRYGHLDIVKFLMDDKSVTIDDTRGNIPMLIACQYGHLDVLEALCQNYKLTNILNHKGYGPLHIACRYGHLDIVKFLMDDKSVTTEDINGNTPMLTACQYGHLDIVEALSQNYKLTNHLNYEGYGPLHIGCKYGHKGIVQFCIRSLNLNPFCSYNSKCLTPFHLASVEGHLNIVEIFLSETQPSPTDHRGYTPLHYACQNGCLEIVQYFSLTKESELLQKSTDNNTALHVAVCHDKIKIVKYFFDNNLHDPNLKGENGKTPLVLAAFYESIETLRYLISEYSKCDYSITDDSGKTAFYYIFVSERKNMVNLYIKSLNYEIHAKSNEEKVLLYTAYDQQQHATFKYMCESLKLNPESRRQFITDKTDDLKNTSLHLACMYGCIETVRYIIEEVKLNVSIANKDGDTCFHLASKSGRLSIIKYLSSIISNEHCRNQNGSTPLHTACQYGQLKVVEYLYTSEFEDLLDRDGRNPFHIANIYGHLEIVSFYFNKYNYKDDLQFVTPIQQICKIDNQETFHFLDMPDNHGYTPLHHASIYGHLGVVEYLVLRNRSRLFYKDSDNNTPLHIAVRYNQLKVVKFFMEQHSYDFNIKGESGMNLMFIAAFYKCKKTLDYILLNHKKCDIQVLDDEDQALIAYLYMVDRFHAIREIIDTSMYNIAGKNCKCDALLYCATEEGQYISFRCILHFMAMCGNETISDILYRNTDTEGNTALHLACKYGRIDTVKYILQTGHNPNLLNDHHQSCFCLASEHDQLSVIEYLCSTSADPFIEDNYGSNALEIVCQHGHLDIIKCLSVKYSEIFHVACCCGKLEIVKFCIDFLNMDPCSFDSDGLSPLHHACIGGSLEVVQYLGIETYISNKADYSPLHYACKHGHLHIVKYYSTESKKQLFHKDCNNNLPLHVAIQYDQIELVKYFLEERLYDFDVIGEYGRTPLVIAAVYKSMKTLDYLHNTYSCDQIEDSYGKSFLVYLFENHRFDMIKTILNNSIFTATCSDEETKIFLYLASQSTLTMSFKHVLNFLSVNRAKTCHRIVCEIADMFGNTALHIACKFECLDTVQYLLDEVHILPYILNADRQTCLHLAAQHGQLSVVTLLTSKYKCDPLCYDKYGLTSLHYAAQNGYIAILKYLIIDLQVGTEVKDVLSNTLLHVASKNGEKEVVNFLLDASSELLVYNNDGNTPLHLACRENHYNIFTLLLSTTKYDIHEKNKLDISIVDYAQDKPEMLQFIRGMYGIEATFIPKIFVIGFSGAGKSTLVSALQREGSRFGRYLSVPKVPPHTVGVVPVKFRSSSYGTVNLYDFAGHEEYHANHQLLFENSYIPIVLLVINLNKEEHEIISNIKYWIHVLKNSIVSNIQVKNRASIVILGSHYDQLKGEKQKKLNTLKLKIEKTLSKLKGDNIEYNRGLICLDCRKSSSSGIETLRGLIESICLSFRARLAVNFSFEQSLICQEVLQFLNKSVSFKIAITISDICEMARESQLISDVVKSESEMFDICKTLSIYGKLVLFIDSTDPLKSWAILDEKHILSEFHKSMQQLLKSKTISCSSDLMSCGLVSLTQLQDCFPEKLSIFLKYLQYNQICTRIDAESFTIIPQVLLTECYYFFPYLMENNKPDLFTLQQEEYKTPFYCWQLISHDPFTPRFLQVLLVQLTVPLTGAGDALPPSYGVWKNGIHIKSNDTTECIIEVNSPGSQLVFAIRCEKSREAALLTRRCQLISLMLSLLIKHCPLINYQEFFFQPQTSYPINSKAQKIMLQKTVGAIIEGRPRVVTYDGSQYLDLDAVMCSDPILQVDPNTLKRIYLHPDDIIPSPTVEKLCQKGNISKILNPSDHLTYKELQERLFKYTVLFCYNIWDTAGCELKPFPVFLMKYKLNLESIKHFISYNPLTINLKEGESCRLPFTVQSSEDYCYGHILKKQGTTFTQVVEKSIVFQNVSKNDSSTYELQPKHQGWSGEIQISLSVQFPPEYEFLEESNSLISVTEGSTKQLKFAVSANPSLVNGTDHELTCIKGEVKVPTTRRFTVCDNTIILNDIIKSDAGLYQISCTGVNGQIGKKIFELKVLSVPEYLLSDTFIHTVEGCSHEITFSVSSDPPLSDDTVHKLYFLKEKDQLSAPENFTISQNTITMNSVSCKDSGTYQISCVTKEGLIGKATFIVSVITPPKYEFLEENDLLISVTDSSTKHIKFNVSANPPLVGDTNHKLTCLNGGIEVPVTRRFSVCNNTIILNDVTKSDAGLYQISCIGGNGLMGKEIFEIKVLSVPEYLLSDTIINTVQGSSHEIVFSVSSDPPLPDDTKHKLCLLKENDMQLSVPEKFTVSQNTITMTNLSCEDSGTYQISCTTKEGLIGKATFNVSVIVPPKYKFLEENDLLISVTDGSTKQIKFNVSANPPLVDDTNHKLTCLNGGVEVPATRRFSVCNNTIILNDVTKSDAGLYQISCIGGNGVMGKEIFELQILSVPEYLLSNTTVNTVEGSSHEIVFSVSSDSPLPDDIKHELCLLKENDIQLSVSEKFTVSQNTITMTNVSCEDSGTYQISCTTKEGLIGKATFSVSVIDQLLSTSLSITEDFKEMKVLKDNWKVLLKTVTFDMIWLAGEMNRTGLLSDYDHLDVTKAKSVLNDIDKASIMLESLKKKILLDPNHWNIFIDILRAKGVYRETVALIKGCTECGSISSRVNTEHCIYQELLGKIPSSLHDKLNEEVLEGHLQVLASKLHNWEDKCDLFGLKDNSDICSIKQEHGNESAKQRIRVLTLWKERCENPTYKKLLQICAEGGFIDSANLIVHIMKQ